MYPDPVPCVTADTLFISGFEWGSCYSIFTFISMFCRSLFVLWYFFFLPMCFLFFDIRILITPLVSSNSSCYRNTINIQIDNFVDFEKEKVHCIHHTRGFCSSPYNSHTFPVAVVVSVDTSMYHVYIILVIFCSASLYSK
jgi:hypothetical protein